MKKILVTLMMIVAATSLFAAKKGKMTEKDLINFLKNSGLEYKIVPENEMDLETAVELNSKSSEKADAMTIEEFVTNIETKVATSYRGPAYLECQKYVYMPNYEQIPCTWENYGSFGGTRITLYELAFTGTYLIEEKYIPTPISSTHLTVKLFSGNAWDVYANGYDWVRVWVPVLPSGGFYSWVLVIIPNTQSSFRIYHCTPGSPC